MILLYYIKEYVYLFSIGMKGIYNYGRIKKQMGLNPTDTKDRI